MAARGWKEEYLMLLAWIIGLAVLVVWYGSYWTIRKDDAESGMPQVPSLFP